jgi:quinolinate synthase
MPVVQAADGSGSTAYIVKEIEQAPVGSAVAVGTEINLVNRLAAQYPDKTVFCLDPVVCPCSTMYRIHPAYLAWSLDRLLDGEVVNRITVDQETADQAKIALERMLRVHP